ncbi:TPA: hypothetical protein ACH3X1_001536 [Trebouxia sp. C0004]
MCLNSQAQQSEQQHVTGFAAPGARRSGLPLQRPITLSAKQKTTQRKPVARLLNILRRPGRSLEADQASTGTLSSIAEPDTAGLFRTSASEVPKQGFRASKGAVRLNADASLQQNTQPGCQASNAPKYSLQLCSAEDSEQDLANCKSPTSLQQALPQGVSVSADRVSEKSQADQTPPGAGIMSVDDSESAGIRMELVARSADG